MQLCYRGVSYEYNPTPVEIIKGEVKGKYRGLPWQETYVKMNKRLRGRTYDLYYRGVRPERQNVSEPNGIPAAEPSRFSSL